MNMLSPCNECGRVVGARLCLAGRMICHHNDLRAERDHRGLAPRCAGSLKPALPSTWIQGDRNHEKRTAGERAAAYVRYESARFCDS